MGPMAQAIHEDFPEGTGPLTEADYWNFPEDGLHRQLLDGWEVVMPPVKLRHQDAIGELWFHILGFLKAHPLGRVSAGPYPVRLSNKSVVEPDLFFVARERTGIMDDRICQEAPDLVVEVLSPSNRRIDEVRKLRLYERHGAQEYWVVDTVLQLVKVFRRVGERLEIQAQVMADAGDLLTTPLLPGLEIPVDRLFPAGSGEDLVEDDPEN